MKSLEKIDEIVRKIEGTSFFKKFKQKEAAEILEKRQEVAGKIAALEAERSEKLPKLQSALAQKEKAMKQAESALEKATVDYNRVRTEKWGRSHQFDYQIGQQRALMIETADPAIDGAIKFFQLKLDWLRRPGRFSRSAQGSALDLVSLKRTTKEINNSLAISDALKYCQDAIQKLELMKLQPVFDGGSVEELKAGVPPLDVFFEFSGERPPKKLRVDNTISNLVKKAQRVAGSCA